MVTSTTSTTATSATTATTAASAAATAAATATSSIVSTLGAGSGIDMTALATNLANVQYAGRLALNAQNSATLDRQISAASTLKNDILNLASSVGDQVRSGAVSTQPTIANAAVATVTRGTASASTGYTLEVSALATAQTLTSQPFTATTSPVGSGTLTLSFGATTATGFTADPAQTPVNITIPAGATLTDVATAINTAGTGVSAYVATGTDGAHLMLKGQQGANNGFVLSASETPGDPGLSKLAWNPQSGGAPGQLIAGSADASFKLDGLAMTSASNTITDVAPGLSVTLTGTNPGAPTAISFSDPSTAVTSFMTDLTSALNAVMTDLNTDVNPASGDLSRDPGTRALRSAMSALAGTVIMPNAPAGSPKTLADLGLATNRDGTFRLDGTRLAATLKSNPGAVSAMFTTGLYGVYSTIDNMSLAASSATDPGSLTGSVTKYTAQKTKLADDATKLSAAQDKLRTQLIGRFAKVDTSVGNSKSTLSFIQAQIAAWNAPKN